MKSDAEYVQSSIRCPFCNAESVEGGSFEASGRTATQEIWCNSCNATWDDVYQLIGYTMISGPDTDTDATPVLRPVTQPREGFVAEDPNDYEDEPDTCTNLYACPCGEDWEIEATCGHNDRCPKCNKEIEPYYSDSYDDPEPRGKEITAAYNALAHRKETT